MSKSEGFFQRIKNFLSEGVEETVSDVVEEIDTSIEEPQVSELPSIRYSPNTSGAEVEGADSFYQARSFSADAGKEVPHQDVRYRQEHEPYRYEPEGDKNVCVTRARLYEVHPLTNNINIHELSPLKIKVLRDCVVYSEFFTNNQGAIIDGPDPNEGKYRLKVAKTLPVGTHFELPDENDAEGNPDEGVEGKYYIPLFYIKSGKLDRDHWNNVGLDPSDNNNNRTVQLFGGLRGHRGPLWWHRGYNKLVNIGDGKNVYKRYVLFNDEKELRSIDTRPQPEDSSTGFTFGPFSAADQINVDYSDDNKEIHVYGNRYNKHWKIGGVGVGVVQDGLVSCISDLNCKDLTTRELNTTTVLTSSGTTTVLTSSGTTTVLTGGSSIAVLTGGSTTAVINSVDSTTVIASVGGTSVINSVGATDVMSGAGTTTVINGVGATSVVQSVGTTAVINSVDTTTVAKGPESSDYANDVWSGGSASAGGGMTAVKVAGCGATDSSDDTCYWVLGVEATGDYASSPPTFPALITGASQSTAVLKSLSTTTVLNSSTTTEVHNSVNTTSVLNSSTTTAVHNSVNTTSVLNSSTTTLVYNSVNTTSVLDSSTTTNVLIGTTTANAISAASTTTVLTAASTTTVLTAGSTTSVYAAHASGTHKFLEAPSGSSDSSVVKVVECPTGSDLCPST